MFHPAAVEEGLACGCGVDAGCYAVLPVEGAGVVATSAGALEAVAVVLCGVSIGSFGWWLVVVGWGNLQWWWPGRRGHPWCW